MLIDTYTWLIVLGTLILVTALLSLKRILKLRVRIKSYPSKQWIGSLEMEDNGTGADVLLPGGASKNAIGRVTVDDKSNRNNGYVDLITTDINDETEKPHYRQCGYINFDRPDDKNSEHGLIYKQVKGKKGKELLGYTACPSAPNTPSLTGERNWKTLWLVCTLNAYAGKPNPKIDELAKEEKKNKKKKKGKDKDINKKDSAATPVDEPLTKANCLRINADAGEQENSLDTKETAVKTEVAPVSNDAPEENPQVSEIEVTDEAKGTAVNEEAPVSEETTETSADTEEKTQNETVTESQETETETNEPSPETKDTKLKNTQPKDPEIPAKVGGPLLLAVCSYKGFHSLSSNPLPPEARACAYAVIQRQFASRKYSEQYKAASNIYGWKDTALISSVIYSILFLIVYLVNTGIFQMPLLGNDLIAVLILTLSYPAIWAIVRLIKIDCIENSNSFQPQLELINKNLGLKWSNILILVFCAISLVFCKYYYDFDFIPLILAIACGVGVNTGMKAANRPWKIRLSYVENDLDEEDEEENENEELPNPTGDISRTYEWDLDSQYSSSQIHGELTLYFSANEMKDVRHCNPFFLQRKDKSDKEYILDMFHFLKAHKSFLARVRYIASYIDKVGKKKGFSPLDRIQFILDFIQEPNIKFCENKDSRVINFYDNYIRYPDETLYDKEGDCNSKSLLAAMLFHVMGYNVLYLISRKHQHAAVGIQVNRSDIENGWYGGHIEDICIRHEGKYYIFCETSSDNCCIGRTISGMDLDDFSEKVPLLLVEGEDDKLDNGDEQESRIYNWDLDSERGNKLHGNLTLDFNPQDIAQLRQDNPFLDYGKNANTYDMNIQTIFDYILAEPSRMEQVKKVAEYVIEAADKAKLPELDKVQFALDFVQAPNITYCIDENSAGIEYAKEYMRFPDEVLFDKEGDCDCKSSLAAAIFHAMGYSVIVMLSSKLQHAAIGIECHEEWLKDINIENLENVVREYNGKRYLYCETTGDGFKIGHIKENESIQDFDTIVELLA